MPPKELLPWPNQLQVLSRRINWLKSIREWQSEFVGTLTGAPAAAAGRSCVAAGGCTLLVQRGTARQLGSCAAPVWHYWELRLQDWARLVSSLWLACAPTAAAHCCPQPSATMVSIYNHDVQQPPSTSHYSMCAASEFVECVTDDLLGQSVFVFTPSGEVRRLFRSRSQMHAINSSPASFVAAMCGPASFMAAARGVKRCLC